MIIMINFNHPLISLLSFEGINSVLISFHQSRGLDDRELLPYFPFRDDGIIILTVIEAMVKDYVNL